MKIDPIYFRNVGQDENTLRGILNHQSFRIVILEKQYNDPSDSKVHYRVPTILYAFLSWASFQLPESSLETLKTPTRPAESQNSASNIRENKYQAYQIELQDQDSDETESESSN